MKIEDNQKTAYDRLEDAIWELRLELKARQELLEQRIGRSEIGSHAWHQLQGQAMEVDNLVTRLANL